jgi:hypothetical protein
MADIHQNDIGLMFKLTVKDQDGSIVPLDNSYTLQVVFQLPDKSTMTKTALLFSDGSDGIVKYVTVANDLSQAGRWKLQAVVSKTVSSVLQSRFHSDSISFKVAANLG